jgi:TolA-binding protein
LPRYRRRFFRRAEPLELEQRPAITEGAAQLKVQRAAVDKVMVRLRRGKIRSAVRSRRYRWTFVAGPYRTVVLGTVLSLQWKPSARQLVVQVSRGRVRVKGGVIGDKGVIVTVGRRLTVRAGKLEIKDVKGPQSAKTRDAGAGARDTSASDARSKKTTPLSAKWRVLALRGQHTGALTEAKRQGFARLLRRLGAQDLLLLADVARLGGDSKRARQALLACRQRFPRSRPSGKAAFLLGRLSAEARRSPRAAARWFRTFLRESPRSPLRADATGRLMLALWRSGQQEAAAQVARRYLAKYPRGAYAEAAKRCQVKKSP